MTQPELLRLGGGVLLIGHNTRMAMAALVLHRESGAGARILANHNPWLWRRRVLLTAGTDQPSLLPNLREAVQHAS